MTENSVNIDINDLVIIKGRQELKWGSYFPRLLTIDTEEWLSWGAPRSNGL